MSIIEKALSILRTREFIQTATAGKEGKPNCAPKLLLKISGRDIYLIDYSIGTTFENLRENPRISLSFIDMDSLLGYKLNGEAQIIEKGDTYNECLEEWADKEMDLTVERVVKGVHEGKKYKEFELGISSRLLVYKIKILEGSEITSHGDIKHEKG